MKPSSKKELKEAWKNVEKVMKKNNVKSDTSIKDLINQVFDAIIFNQ